MTLSQTDGVDDFFPVGAVISFGGKSNLLSGNGYWLYCDGAIHRIQDYPVLYQAIGNTYGGSKVDGTFKVPDYQGRFLRGVPHSSNGDSEAVATASGVGTAQGCATKVPAKPFQAVVNNLPPSSFTVIATVAHAAGPGGSSTLNTCTSGGNGDTRPVNVYVHYFIKAK